MEPDLCAGVLFADGLPAGMYFGICDILEISLFFVHVWEDQAKSSHSGGVPDVLAGISGFVFDVVRQVPEKYSAAHL